MANTVSILKRLRELPPAVQDFIFDENAHELGGKVLERNGLSDSQALTVFGLLKEIYLKDIQLTQIVPELVKRVGFDEEKSMRLAADIAGYYLLPLDKWIGDVDSYLRKLGADPKLYPATRIQIATRTADEAAEETIRSIGDAAAAEAALKKRQEDLVKSYFSGIRTEKQLKEVLMRPSKVGGLGMSQDQADRVALAAAAEKAAVQIRTYAPGATEEAPAEAAAPASGDGAQAEAKPAGDTFATIRPEDELEIERLKKKVEAAVPLSSQDTARKIEESIKELYAQTGFSTPDEVMQKRLKTIIGNRLRDIRDSLETVEALVQSKQLGGMGFPEGEARRIVSMIEAKLKLVHEAHKAEVLADKRKWVENEAAHRKETEEAAGRKEAEERERMFADLLAKTGKGGKAAPVAPRPPLEVTPPPAVAAAKREAMPAQPKPVPETKIVPPPPNLPSATPMPVPPTMRPPAIVPLEEKPVAPPAPPQTPAAPAAPRPPLTVMRPTMAPAMPVAPPPAASAPPVRPKIEDVKPPLQLVGPVEEIRTMSLVDFRKLARDPKDAVARVKEKIDMLRQESYEKRNLAIEAWGSSEVSRTYLDMMKEALSGKPMNEVMAARQAAGKPVLNPEETAAVADLNRQLRY